MNDNAGQQQTFSRYQNSREFHNSKQRNITSAIFTQSTLVADFFRNGIVLIRVCGRGIGLQAGKTIPHCLTMFARLLFVANRLQFFFLFPFVDVNNWTN